MTKSVLGDRQTRVLGERFYSDTNKRVSFTLQSGIYSTTSNTFEDIPNMTIAIFLEKETNVLIQLSAHVYISIGSSGYIANATFSVDGVDHGAAVASTDYGKPESESIFSMYNLSAGSHTIVARLRTGDDTETVDAVATNTRLTVIY